MKPIFEYYDYREYMRAFYEERKRIFAFSWREFSKIAGFTSPNYMKVVCDGKSRLSKIGVARVANAMGLADHEKLYFEKLVALSDATDESKKRKILSEIQEMAKVYKIKMLDGDAFAYFESWLNPVLRELAPMNPGKKPLALSKMCYPQVSATEVRRSLDFMVHAGILKNVGEDRYEQTEKIVSGATEIMPLAIRSMHRQMAKNAVDSIDSVPVSKRNFNGVTLSVTQKEYDLIVAEMEIFRQRILSIASGVESGDQVYRLNLQFFPLTKSKENDHE